jgi:flagellar protein FlaG
MMSVINASTDNGLNVNQQITRSSEQDLISKENTIELSLATEVKADKKTAYVIAKVSDIKQQDKVLITSEQLEQVAQKLQDFVGEMNKSLEFSVDKDSGRDVIKVIDKNSGDLIKQYPTEEVLDLVAKLSEATGNLINLDA